MIAEMFIGVCVCKFSMLNNKHVHVNDRCMMYVFLYFLFFFRYSYYVVHVFKWTLFFVYNIYYIFVIGVLHILFRIEPPYYRAQPV